MESYSNKLGSLLEALLESHLSSTALAERPWLLTSYEQSRGEAGIVLTSKNMKKVVGIDKFEKIKNDHGGLEQAAILQDAGTLDSQFAIYLKRQSKQFIFRWIFQEDNFPGNLKEIKQNFTGAHAALVDLVFQCLPDSLYLVVPCYKVETYSAFFGVFFPDCASDQFPKALCEKTAHDIHFIIDIYGQILSSMQGFFEERELDASRKSYARLAYILMHEDNGFTGQVDAFLSTLKQNNFVKSFDSNLKDSIEQLEMSIQSKRQWMGELRAPDPFTHVPISEISEKPFSSKGIIKLIVENLKKRIPRLQNMKVEIADELPNDFRLTWRMLVIERIIKIMLNNSLDAAERTKLEAHAIVRAKAKGTELLELSVEDICGGPPTDFPTGEITFTSLSRYLASRPTGWIKGNGLHIILRYATSTKGSLVLNRIKINSFIGTQVMLILGSTEGGNQI